jgi:uncharacterized protein (DUF924 family)
LLPGSRAVSETAGPQDVLDYWFGPRLQRGPSRPEWFRKDAAFDEGLRERFGALHAAAASGECDGWRAEREPMLALVVVLDQFSRNLHRNDARAFAQDAYAIACTREALARGDDRVSLPVERQFLYMPLEHSEDPADQDRCVELMSVLGAYPETRGLVTWADKHRNIIRRFGRFPHRNAALGRVSTPEEAAFLAQPGSSF